MSARQELVEPESPALAQPLQLKALGPGRPAFPVLVRVWPHSRRPGPARRAAFPRPSQEAGPGPERDQATAEEERLPAAERLALEVWAPEQAPIPPLVRRSIPTLRKARYRSRNPAAARSVRQHQQPRNESALRRPSHRTAGAVVEGMGMTRLIPQGFRGQNRRLYRRDRRRPRVRL